MVKISNIDSLNINITFLFLKANSNKTYIDHEEQTLFVNCIDIYENLTLKMITAYHYLFNNTN